MKINSIVQMFAEYGFTVLNEKGNHYQLLYSENELVDDIVAECDAESDKEAFLTFQDKALEYIKSNNLSKLTRDVEIATGSDKYIIYSLSEFLRDETLEECPIEIISREDIDGEEAELIRFAFGEAKESCVAIMYDDGTIFTPRDWQSPVWDDSDWSIDDSDWMDCYFRECINFNGMPRMI